MSESPSHKEASASKASASGRLNAEQNRPEMNEENGKLSSALLRQSTHLLLALGVPDESHENEHFSYKEVSEMSEVTQESFPEGYVVSQAGGAVEDLVDFDKLVQQTKQKLVIKESEIGSEAELSVISASRQEAGDEFLRNFFIKFGMKRTLDSFQQEWFELKTKGEIDPAQMPEIPDVYKENIELSNVLTALQKEVDEARIIAEKSRSTYDKLRKQRDFQKINHRRVQQEKSKLNNDVGKLKKKFEEYQGQFDQLSAKYEGAIKEKMLMKLEKDRLLAKVESLEANLSQLRDNNDGGRVPVGEASNLELQGQGSPLRTRMSQISGKKGSPDKTASQGNLAAGRASSNKFVAAGAGAATGAPPQSRVPKVDPQNPLRLEEFEPINAHMNPVKTFKGHLMGVTCMSYNPKKDILATGSDDTTWKLWSIPNGDLIMSGEGHQDWIGGVSFHPKGSFLATASGDGCVKIWDFMQAKCAHTYAEHGQPVWRCDFHYTGDFLLSCSMDHSVKLWDLAVPKASRFTFRGHVDSVNSVQWQPYSSMFVSGAGDKTVSLWDIRTNLCVQTFYGHNNAVNTVKFNVRGDMIVSGDCDGINKVWDIRMVKELCQFDSGLSSSNCAIFDKSGTFVIVGNEDSTIKVFNLTSKEKEGELKGHEDAVLDLCFDNNKEAMLLSASADCSFRIWQ